MVEQENKDYSKVEVASSSGKSDKKVDKGWATYSNYKDRSTIIIK